MTNLNGFKVAILVANGFEQVEMTEPKNALEKAGAKVEIISPEKEKVKGWQSKDWGDEFKIDRALDEANPDDYDALILPGGVMNPDKLRENNVAVSFVKKIYHANKPIAAICHGPWTLINADIIKGHTVTSYASIKLDLKNAGATWVDKSVVIDGKLITSRKPDDIPDFNEAILKVFSKELVASH
jgi:protease I